MKLIFGLGNPGSKYENSRHNLGQNIIKQFIETFYRTSLTTKPNLSAAIHENGQGSDKTIFATSTDYMNNSGVTAQKIAQFYKISPENIYIIHDDLDLKVGDYKIQFDRGPAGHNGIKSIVENLNTQAFNRLRIGIDKPQDQTPIENYVLQPFSAQERDTIESITPKIFEIIKNF